LPWVLASATPTGGAAAGREPGDLPLPGPDPIWTAALCQFCASAGRRVGSQFRRTRPPCPACAQTPRPSGAGCRRR
jgi:hypothetical protein